VPQVLQTFEQYALCVSVGYMMPLHLLLRQECCCCKIILVRIVRQGMMGMCFAQGGTFTCISAPG
jgi:hypothetical protein